MVVVNLHHGDPTLSPLLRSQMGNPFKTLIKKTKIKKGPQPKQSFFFSSYYSLVIREFIINNKLAYSPG